MNKVTVKINGHEYNMVGKESKDYLLKVANYVDEKMEEISKANPKLSTAMAAVLTSLNIADELFKCSYELDEVTSKYKQPLQDLEDATTVLEELKNSIQTKDERIQELEKQLEKHMEDINKLKEENEKLQKELKEKEEKLSEAEEIANDFQNRLYDMQIKIVELEKKE
ncbi:cell division protein ZapA [Tepidibacter formicigenes]|uniref:Cell division protein ZapA n=1 Tax=Tepidibacter formicigenes DSM 15518 TaxID=1123349 RepID=A0A1M6KQY2_9FIRM|nr:cell division protein ZapA [Tepidibacter formicigenes]SHJ61393.1 cell division protein ZapA [Tepidibacter formicigenes DSM 15518]